MTGVKWLCAQDVTEVKDHSHSSQTSGTTSAVYWTVATPITKDMRGMSFERHAWQCSNSCRGLVRLTRYLLSMYSDRLDHVLTGNIHSDYIEGHFADLRKLSGGNYWVSARQFRENEAAIRTKGECGGPDSP